MTAMSGGGGRCCPAAHPVRPSRHFLSVSESAEKWETLPWRRRGGMLGGCPQEGWGEIRGDAFCSRRIAVFNSWQLTQTDAQAEIRKEVVRVKGPSLRVCLYKGRCAGSCRDVTLREAGVSVLTDPGRPLVNTSGAPFRTIRGVEDDDIKKAL